MDIGFLPTIFLTMVALAAQKVKGPINVLEGMRYKTHPPTPQVEDLPLAKTREPPIQNIDSPVPRAQRKSA